MNNLEPLMTSARTGDSLKDEWQTPLWLFDLLNREFKFDLDPAATIDNTLCDRWFTKVDDGLKKEWIAESVFINPPYSQMRQWVEKAYGEIILGNCDVAVLLVAARTDTRAWWDHIRHGEVRFLKGRLKFDMPPEMIEMQEKEAAERALRGKTSKIVKNFSAPFPSAVAIFRRNHWIPKTVYWEVKEKK